MLPFCFFLLILIRFSISQVADPSKFFCRQPGPVKGPCNERIQRWYHNFKSGKCLQFEYGGCNGNYNNFASKKDCELQCKGTSGAKFHATIKEGTCVNYPNQPHWTPWGLCTHMCAQYDDASCPGDQKCCFNGCGFQCVHPDSASWGIKNGKCPDPKSYPLDKIQSSRRSTTLILCMTDNSCERREKCCEYPDDDVGFVCVPALEDLAAPKKPGTCQEKPEVKIDCASYAKILCDSDRQCKGSAKCCDLGCGKECSVPAELTTMPPPTELTTTPLPPLAEEEDEPGDEVCPLMGKRCGLDETPYMFCAQDSDCSTGQKCCHDGCGYVCAEPFWIPKMIFNATTMESTTPTTTEPTTTTTGTTTPAETTTTTTTLKPTPSLEEGLSPFKVFGWCPPPSLCSATNFYLDCVTDVKCPFDKKCCFNGCGYECIAPQLPKFLRGTTTAPSTTVSTSPLEDARPSVDDSLSEISKMDVLRRGFCGLEKKRCGGAGPATGETYFYQSCKMDVDCEEPTFKCCFDGCGYECQKPRLLKDDEDLVENVIAERKPGVCPPPGISNAVVSLCRTDGDCYGPYKCCNTLGGRECVPASLPVVEERKLIVETKKPTLDKNNNDDDDKNNNNDDDDGDNLEEKSGNMVVAKPSTGGHAYCQMTRDILLPSGQSPVIKGMIHLHETIFWGLNVQVKMTNLPVPRGLPAHRKLGFQVQVLDSVDEQFGCMIAPVYEGGDLGVVVAKSDGVIDDEAIKKNGFTVVDKQNDADSSYKNIDGSLLAISTVGSNQRVGCCRVQVCRSPCCQGPYTGHCMAYLERFYYDWASGKCLQFVYGGCGAQENNFRTKEECQRKCAGFRP